MTSSSKKDIESLKAATDELSSETAKEAIEQLRRDGITADSELPFLRPTYNHASLELCKKLQSFGLLFVPEVIGTHLEYEGNVYAIYNPEMFDYEDAVEWPKVKYQST